MTDDDSIDNIKGGLKPGSHQIARGRSYPDLVIVWDAEVLSPERYAELVTLIGDLVRAEGGLGIKRISSMGVGAKEQA